MELGIWKVWFLKVGKFQKCQNFDFYTKNNIHEKNWILNQVPNIKNQNAPLPPAMTSIEKSELRFVLSICM